MHIQLEFLREMKYSWEECAAVLMVSRTTLWRRAQELGISRAAFSNISDTELDSVVERIAHQAPSCGVIMVWGQLRSYGVNVPRRRVRESLLRVSPRGVQQRRTTTISRRTYSVPSSNALWHIDGQHSLVRWRIVIHGGIDGYSRKVVYLRASSNNRASTVLELFLHATRHSGWPSRVRSDMGGENIEVARVMIAARGLGRSSHIAGKSVHNQRIERLWRDTFRCVSHIYYSMFYEMEDSCLLNPTNEIDLFCLQYVFIPRLNIQLEKFLDSWNNHPLRTENGLSPLQLWTRGLCLADSSVIEQPPGDFGIEYGERGDPFDLGSISVPESCIQLSDAQVEELNTYHPPLSQSDYFGLDTYIAVRETVSHMVPG